MKYQYKIKLKIDDQINLHKILSIVNHNTVSSSCLVGEQSVFRT